MGWEMNRQFLQYVEGLPASSCAENTLLVFAILICIYPNFKPQLRKFLPKRRLSESIPNW